MNSASVAAARLRASLDAIAGALRSPNLEGLLSAEIDLSAALAGLARLRGVDPLDRAAVRDELAAARVALSRCRSFGAVIDDFAQATFVAQGRGGDYDRAGSRPAPGSRGVGLKARM
jgi:hypothetical protein